MDQSAAFPTEGKNPRSVSSDLSSLFASRLNSERPAMNMLGDTQRTKPTPAAVVEAPKPKPAEEPPQPIVTPKNLVREISLKPAEQVKVPIKPVEEKDPISMELEELAKTVARHNKNGDADAEDEARETAKRHLTIEAMALDTEDMETQFEESIARFEESVEKHKQSGEPIKVRIGGVEAAEEPILITSDDMAPTEEPIEKAPEVEEAPEPEKPQAFCEGEPVTIESVYTDDTGKQVMEVIFSNGVTTLVHGDDITYAIDEEEDAPTAEPLPETPEEAPAPEDLQPEVQLLIEEGEEEKLLEAEASPEPEHHKEWQDVERFKFQEISGNTFWAAKWNAAQRGTPDFILNFGVEATDTDFDIERKRQENRVILIAGGSALAASELHEAAVTELYVNDETRVLFEAVAYEVGFKVLQNLTDRQLGEYEAIVNADQSVIDAWLEQHIPDYKTSPVYQQIEAGYENDPEKNDPVKLFAGIAWLQQNSPEYETIANEVASEFTPRFEEIEEKEDTNSNVQKIDIRM